MLFCWCIISCRIWSCSTSSPLTRTPWLGSRSSRRLVFRKVTSVRFISQHWRRKSKYLWISFSWNDKLLCRSLPRSFMSSHLVLMIMDTGNCSLCCRPRSLTTQPAMPHAIIRNCCFYTRDASCCCRWKSWQRTTLWLVFCGEFSFQSWFWIPVPECSVSESVLLSSML